MWKRSVCGAVLAAGVLLPAGAQTMWTFSYTGFDYNGVWNPDAQFSGSFLGDDLDGDGIVEQTEIQRLIWDGLWYEPFGTNYCGGGGVYCTLDNFSYRLDGTLNFRTDWYYRDEMSSSVGGSLIGHWISSAGSVGDGGSTGTDWRWTGQTRFAINPPPVPEPGQYALLAAGLLATTLWRAARQLPRPRRRQMDAPGT